MALFDRTGDKLAAGPTLVLAADPGPAVLDTARRYDPELRQWRGRLVFGNGVLLFGPIEITPKLGEQARLPAGVALAARAGGIAIDMFGFRFATPQELLAAGEGAPEP